MATLREQLEAARARDIERGRKLLQETLWTLSESVPRLTESVEALEDGSRREGGSR